MEDHSIPKGTNTDTVLEVPHIIGNAGGSVSQKEVWAFIFVIAMAVVNGLVGLTGLIKMMVVISKIGTKAWVVISVFMFIPMILSSALYSLLAIGPLDKIRKNILYAGVGIIGLCYVIQWLAVLFGGVDVFDQFVYNHVVGAFCLPFFYALMAFYDDCELAKIIFPHPVCPQVN